MKTSSFLLWFFIMVYQLFHDADPYHIETSSLICFAKYLTYQRKHISKLSGKGMFHFCLYAVFFLKKQFQN